MSPNITDHCRRRYKNKVPPGGFSGGRRGEQRKVDTMSSLTGFIFLFFTLGGSCLLENNKVKLGKKTLEERREQEERRDVGAETLKEISAGDYSITLCSIRIRTREQRCFGRRRGRTSQGSAQKGFL